MKAFFLWSIVNIFLGFCFVYGYLNEIDGWINLGLVLVWIDTIMSFFFLSSQAKDALKNRKLPVSSVLTHLSNVVVVGFLTWGGFWITMIAFIMGWTVNYHVNNRIDDYQSGVITLDELLNDT